MIYIIAYFIIINLLTCIFYGLDKLKAMSGGRRTPEKVLIGLAFVGGSIGAFVGMQVFRHKTRHWKFRILVPLFIIFHIGGVLYVYLHWFV